MVLLTVLGASALAFQAGCIEKVESVPVLIVADRVRVVSALLAVVKIKL